MSVAPKIESARADTSRARERGAVPAIVLVALALVLLIAVAAMLRHRPTTAADSQPPTSLSAAAASQLAASAAVRVPNAAQPSSSLPGAVAQAEAQAKEWGPGGGPSVVIPADSSGSVKITLLQPRGTRVVRPEAPATTATGDLVTFASPAIDTMTPCGNAMTQTSLRYRPRMEIEFGRSLMTWDCLFLPTRARAESKIEVDCDKGSVAAWSTVFFRGGKQINETKWAEEMHAPRPATLDATLLSLACRLPQPTAVELGREPVRPEALAPALDACFASAASEMPPAPRGEIVESARNQITSLLMQRCANVSITWLYACGSAGSTREACTDELSKRAVAAFRKARS